MKLDVIEKMASMNRQKMPKDGAGYSVAITKVDSKKNQESGDCVCI